MTLLHTDLFRAARVREIWLDEDGLLRAFVPHERPKRPARNSAWASGVAWAALTFGGITAYAEPLEVPTQLAIAWPQRPARVSSRDALKDSLAQLRGLKPKWNGDRSPMPIERAVSAAQYVLEQIPDDISDARAGVDPDGNVFLRLRQGERYAYLTVEAKAMHLLYLEPGAPDVYIDDAPFNGKVIPNDIKVILNGRLKYQG